MKRVLHAVLIGVLMMQALHGAQQFASTPLCQAARECQVEQVRQILAQNDQVNQRDGYGRTALHWAAINDQIKVINILRAHGACVDMQDNNGQTPWKLAKKALQVTFYRANICNNAQFKKRNYSKCLAMAPNYREWLAHDQKRRKVTLLMMFHERCGTDSTIKRFQGYESFKLLLPMVAKYLS